MNSPACAAEFSTVCVIGLGYVGLPTAAMLSHSGLNVVGVDINDTTVAMVNRGELPFTEEGLEAILADVVAKGKLRATSTPPKADAYIIAVPTPLTADHNADLSYIKAAAEQIAPMLTGGELIVLESTSPPGTTQCLAGCVLASNPELTGEPGHSSSVYFAHCPERVLPGRVMVEMVENDRIIGGLNTEASEKARALYSTFSTGTLLTTNAKTAEMAKLTENTFRDVNIAFANELSVIADQLEIDVWELIELANHHPRVNILQPGPGVGGHCIAVDPWFIVSADRENTRLITSARHVNDQKPHFIVTKALNEAQKFAHPTIAALGITFKANIDDLRESPSRSIVQELASQLPDGNILVVEPYISELPPELATRTNVELTHLDEALAKADIVLLLVDHTPFKAIDSEVLRDTIVIDSKGLWRHKPTVTGGTHE